MLNNKPKLGIIISSTRDNRFAEKPTTWLVQKLEEDAYFEIKVLDLKKFDLPFFNELGSNMHIPTQDKKAQKWQKAINKCDAFIFVTAEYNHSITGALKNALDQAYKEWNGKPFSVLGYGGLGAARATQHLRNIGSVLQMMPVPSAIHIAGAEFLKVHPMGQNQDVKVLDPLLTPSFLSMMDELEWWTDATRSARHKTQGTMIKRGLNTAEILKAMMSNES